MSAMGIRRLLDRWAGRHPAAPVAVLEQLEEAAAPAGVAGHAAHRLHLQHDGVAVAVEADLAHALHVARGLALLPQRAARARPVHRLAALDGLAQRLAIHPCDHQHLARGRVLRHRGHEAVGVPGDVVEPVLHSRISMPRAAMKRLASPMAISPKWNTEAASTASAWPCSIPSARCSIRPTPPLAITGTGTASHTARVSARSKPLLVPSRSMLVSRISPAPCPAIFPAHATASSPRALRPPCVNTSQRPSPDARASMATTMACEP